MAQLANAMQCPDCSELIPLGANAHGCGWASDDLEAIRSALELLGEAAELVRGVDNEYLNAYCMPQLEGQGAGWLGEHLVDHLRKHADALESGEER